MNKPTDFEIPESVRELVEHSVDQAKEAYDRFMEATRQAQDAVAKSSEAMTSGAKDIQEKALKFAEQNVEANFKLAGKLVKARDIQQALEIQNEFARKQMEAYAEQAQELSKLVAKAAQKAQPKG